MYGAAVHREVIELCNLRGVRDCGRE